MDVSSSGRSAQLIFLRRVLHKCFAIIKRENKQHGVELICGHLYGENTVNVRYSHEMRKQQTNLQERKLTTGRTKENRKRKICVIVIIIKQTFTMLFLLKRVTLNCKKIVNYYVLYLFMQTSKSICFLPLNIIKKNLNVSKIEVSKNQILNIATFLHHIFSIWNYVATYK